MTDELGSREGFRLAAARVDEPSVHQLGDLGEGLRPAERLPLGEAAPPLAQEAQLRLGLDPSQTTSQPQAVARARMASTTAAAWGSSVKPARKERSMYRPGSTAR